MKPLEEIIIDNYRRIDGTVDWAAYHQDMERKKAAFDRKDPPDEKSADPSET